MAVSASVGSAGVIVRSRDGESAVLADIWTINHVHMALATIVQVAMMRDCRFIHSNSLLKYVNECLVFADPFYVTDACIMYISRPYYT